MSRTSYDPVKAHEYYERTKKLKGQKGGKDRGGRTPLISAPKNDPKNVVVARVNRLKSKVTTLTQALSAAEAALSTSRQVERQKAKESSDSKSTVEEKQASQKYRDKHQEELKSKAQKKSSSSSSGGSSSSSSSSKSLSDMSSEELGARIIKIRSALQDAKSQLSSATQQLGQLAHSEIISDPNVNEYFARFRSERIPST